MESHYEKVGLVVAGAALGAAALKLLQPAPPTSDITVPGKEGFTKVKSGKVSESTIRLMTRLAIQHKAVNLSQGFPNEAPPMEMSLASAGAMLAGESMESAAAAAEKLKEAGLFSRDKGTKDTLSQYTFPFGIPMLRDSLAEYYKRFYPDGPFVDPNDNVTVVLGATEGFAVCLRALCDPGDKVVFFEPFHELYPSQCTLWGLTPSSVTLHEDKENGTWFFNEAALERALTGAKVFLFNTPHNPTGKVFTLSEMQTIARLCIKHDVLVVTDEIYEHIIFDGVEHLALASSKFPGMAERTCVVNAVSKTFKATGWRVGWVISPKQYTHAIRATHDQLVLQAPTPLQLGAEACLKLPDTYFIQLAATYAGRRDRLARALKDAGFDVPKILPKGAYYLFVGYSSVPALKGLAPTAAAMEMTTKYKVACVPGDNFYLLPEQRSKALYLRFAFVRSDDVIEQAAVNLAKLPK
eukprot:m.48947 g.48947  ORF g.48947 m.48947 type:complete len:467 (+) comp7060_c0_seq1:46-1446(+)